MSKEQDILDFVLENVPSGDPAALIEALDSYQSDKGHLHDKPRGQKRRGCG